MSPWGWRPERTQGIWRHGALWLKPLAALSPWAAAVLCLLLMHVVGNSMTSEKGVLFDLPDAGLDEGEATPLVALVMPLRNESAVFFDDARYPIEDAAAAALLGDKIAERVAKARQKTLLVLADRRIPFDDLSHVAAVAKSSGVKRILFANKRAEEHGE